MLRRIVRFALRQRVLVLAATAALALLGARAFAGLPVEAFPDVEDIHVQVISQWPGHPADRAPAERPALPHQPALGLDVRSVGGDADVRRRSDRLLRAPADARAASDRQLAR